MALVVAEGNGMLMTQKDRSTRRRSYHKVTSPKTNFKLTSLGTNSGLHFHRTATTNTTEKTHNPSLINLFYQVYCWLHVSGFSESHQKAIPSKNIKNVI